MKPPRIVRVKTSALFRAGVDKHLDVEAEIVYVPKFVSCSACDGDGDVSRGDGDSPSSEACEACNGEGRVANTTGEPHETTINVRVDADDVPDDAAEAFAKALESLVDVRKDLLAKLDSAGKTIAEAHGALVEACEGSEDACGQPALQEHTSTSSIAFPDDLKAAKAWRERHGFTPGLGSQYAYPVLDRIAAEAPAHVAEAMAAKMPRQAPVHDFAQQTKGKAIAFISSTDPHREMTKAEIDASPAVVGHCSIHLPNGLVCGEYVRHGIPPGVTCSCKPAPRLVVGTLQPDVSSKA